MLIAARYGHLVLKTPRLHPNSVNSIGTFGTLREISG